MYVIRDLTPPQFVLDLLSLGPKHPLIDKFNKMHFLADMGSLLASIPDTEDSANPRNEVNAEVVHFIKNVKRQQPDRALQKVRLVFQAEPIKGKWTKMNFTNVPVEESIQLAADLLYSSPEVPSFDRETFVELMI